MRLGVKYDGVAERIGAALSREQVSSWLSGAGFGTAGTKMLPQLPGLAILRAERAG